MLSYFWPSKKKHASENQQENESDIEQIDYRAIEDAKNNEHKPSSSVLFFTQQQPPKELIKNFLSELQKKIDSQYFFSWRDLGLNTPEDKQLFILGLLGIMVFPIFANGIIYMKDLGHLQDLLQKNDCVQKNHAGDYNFRNCDVSLSQLCADLCAFYSDKWVNLTGVASFFVGLFGTISELTVLPFTLSKLYHAISQGKERFENLKLNDFAPELKDKAQALLNRIDIENDLSPNVTVKEIRNIFLQTLTSQVESKQEAEQKKIELSVSFS